MTRAYGHLVTCPHCGKEHTEETAFSRFVRQHPDVASNFGYAASDIDEQGQKIIWHKYMWQGRREVQCIMLIEVKTRGAVLSGSQADTMQMLDHIIRNRRQTPTSKTRPQAGRAPVSVYSRVAGKNIGLRVFGIHLLQLSGTEIEDSILKWDGQLIDGQQLLDLLRFKRDPDTLRPFTARSHHKQAMLPLFASVFGVDTWSTP